MRKKYLSGSTSSTVKGLFERGHKKRTTTPKHILRCTETTDFELYRLINWGGRPSPACFPEDFSPATCQRCLRLGKRRQALRPVLPFTLPSSEGVVALPAQHLPRGIIQVSPHSPISPQKSMKNQSI